MVNPRECSIPLEKNVCSAILGWLVWEISVESRRFILLFKSSISVWIFYRVVLSIIGSGILMFPTIVVELSISPFNSLSFCSMGLEGVAFTMKLRLRKGKRPRSCSIRQRLNSNMGRLAPDSVFMISLSHVDSFHTVSHTYTNVRSSKVHALRVRRAPSGAKKNLFAAVGAGHQLVTRTSLVLFLS